MCVHGVGMGRPPFAHRGGQQNQRQSFKRPRMASANTTPQGNGQNSAGRGRKGGDVVRHKEFDQMAQQMNAQKRVSDRLEEFACDCWLIVKGIPMSDKSLRDMLYDIFTNGLGLTEEQWSKVYKFRRLPSQDAKVSVWDPTLVNEIVQVRRQKMKEKGYFLQLTGENGDVTHYDITIYKERTKKERFEAKSVTGVMKSLRDAGYECFQYDSICIGVKKPGTAEVDRQPWWKWVRLLQLEERQHNGAGAGAGAGAGVGVGVNRNQVVDTPSGDSGVSSTATNFRNSSQSVTRVPAVNLASMFGSSSGSNADMAGSSAGNNAQGTAFGRNALRGRWQSGKNGGNNRGRNLSNIVDVETVQKRRVMKPPKSAYSTTESSSSKTVVRNGL